jgi:mono/diheme cytochrome c family protein
MRPTMTSVAYASVGLTLLFVLDASPVYSAASLANPKEAGGAQAGPHWGKVSVELPASNTLFPAGEGQAVANAQCLICHSAGMVLRQPTRTQPQWVETINKMRDSYGAPIAAPQVDELAAYLTRVVSGDSAALESASVQHSPTAPDGKHGSADGAAVFAGTCAVCHQATGKGLPGAFPPLAGSSWVEGRDTTLVQIVLHGVQGTLTVNGTTYNSAMPAFGGQLSDAQIAAVLTYIRSQWGNKTPAVSPTVVSAQRAATATRTGPWGGDSDLAR